MTETETREVISGEVLPNTASTAGADEPRLSLSELRGLLRDAAALERSQRPIVIRSSADAFGAEQQAAPAPIIVVDSRTAPDWTTLAAPAGAMVAPMFAAPAAPLRRPIAVRYWGARLAYAGVAALLAGAADGAVTGTATASVAACAVGIGAIVAGVVRAEVEQKQENGS